MKTLNIIDSAFRATLEEQDDTVIWMVHAMRNAGAELAVLLRGSAVASAVIDQDARGLCFGDLKPRNVPDIAGDIAKLIERHVEVYYIEDDLAPRGLTAAQLLPEMRAVGRGDLPELFEQFDQIWHW